MVVTLADEFDPFAGSTGLPENFNAVITNAWFEFDPEIANGQQLLCVLEMQTDDDNFGDEGVGTLKLSCGKDWDTKDRGATAVRDDGNERKGFHQSTAYQLWIKHAVMCDGAEKVLRSEGRGDPRKAEMWVGTAWFVKGLKVNYGTINGTEVGERTKLVPGEFLGEYSSLAELQRGSGGGSGAPAKSTGPAKKAAPVKKAAVKATAPANNNGGINADLRDELKALAMGADTHDAFVEQAFELAAVSEDEAVQQAVMDSGEGSIWAEAVAEYEAANA